MHDLETFKNETRAWLEKNCPAEMRTPIKSDADICWGGRNYKPQSEAQKLWLERMAAKGWTTPTWPAEYGGGGLSKAEAKVLAKELDRIDARSPLSSFGIWMLGPAIRSQALALISRLLRQNAKIRATISSSMGKRFGPLMLIRQTGFSASCAPTPKPKNMKVLALCSLIWKRRAWKLNRLS